MLYVNVAVIRLFELACCNLLSPDKVRSRDDRIADRGLGSNALYQGRDDVLTV